MNKETKTLLYFVGGMIWAIVSARKAYAPNLQQAEIDTILPNGCPSNKPKLCTHQIVDRGTGGAPGGSFTRCYDIPQTDPCPILPSES